MRSPANDQPSNQPHKSETPPQDPRYQAVEGSSRTADEPPGTQAGRTQRGGTETSRTKQWIPISLAAAVSSLVVVGLALAVHPNERARVIEASDDNSVSSADAPGVTASGTFATTLPTETVPLAAVDAPIPGDTASDAGVGAGRTTVRAAHADAPAAVNAPSPNGASLGGATTAGGRQEAAPPVGTPPGPPHGPSRGHSQEPVAPPPVAPDEGSSSPGTPIDIDFIDQFGGPSPQVFLDGLDQRCIDSGLKAGCVQVSFSPDPPDRGDSRCRVKDQTPPVARTKVKVGSHLTFEVICDDTSDSGGDPQREGGQSGSSS